MHYVVVCATKFFFEIIVLKGNLLYYINPQRTWLLSTHSSFAIKTFITSLTKSMYVLSNLVVINAYIKENSTCVWRKVTNQINYSTETL